MLCNITKRDIRKFCGSDQDIKREACHELRNYECLPAGTANQKTYAVECNSGVNLHSDDNLRIELIISMYSMAWSDITAWDNRPRQKKRKKRDEFLI